MKIGQLQLLQRWAGLADNILQTKQNCAEIKAWHYKCNLEPKFYDGCAVSSPEDKVIRTAMSELL